MSGYNKRFWQGEPQTNEGITHAVGIDVDLDAIAACGRMCDTSADFEVDPTQIVTCLRCWQRAFQYPNLVKW